MSPLQAIFLGILQGLTEFIPVSSSGHLVIAQNFLPGFSQPGVLFDAVLHAGTMLAILIYFRQKIRKLERRMVWLLALGTVPAALVGILLQEQLEMLFSSLRVVGVALLFTGLANYFVDRFSPRTISLSPVKAFLTGVAQAMAIIPGVSRSGLTIFAAVSQGIKKEEAAAFSFLLSVPAVAGAVSLQLVTHAEYAQINFVNYFLGFLAAFLVGYLAIDVVIKALVSRRFKIFALYCFILGLTTLLLAA